ncbi:MAG: helix-turn-helix transcriptional regulator [Pyrinomonadaceae bacterium]|nr:helix-turn-helix transcriptional regulator [Pyrinomonadaceae bacterium]
MGSSPRPKPKYLGKKLRVIRLDRLGLSQTEMSKALGLKVDYSAVSQYELGTREPPLLVLLKYARLSGVSMETLVDDKMRLSD